MDRKAQGLPINTVVLAGLAVLVLLLIAMFVTGGASRIFGAISSAITGRTAGMELETARQTCESLYQAWVNAGCSEVAGKAYCCKKFDWIDVDGDGYGDPTRDKTPDTDDYYNVTCDDNSKQTHSKALLGAKTCGSGSTVIDCSKIDC